ncbi:MAG: hypothetical protein QOG83_2238 [Alphaproteobacteria bacterium]|nr:hypothetical protein [Alphaproteobacteria bacterium]
MPYRSLVGTTVVAAALIATLAAAQAFDQSKYPDLKGQWVRGRVAGVTGQPSYDPTKSQGRAQQAPLIPEYQAIFEANIKEQAAGGQAGDPTYTCLSPGMPRIMNPYGDMEFVITPETTHILIEHIHDSRRIHTDGRDWPKTYIDPSFQGYSLGRWSDTDGDGRFDTLEVETRHFKGPRAFDASGIPLHADNQTVVKERIHWDKTNPNALTNELATIDNALTRPWAVTKKYVRKADKQPVWFEEVCTEGNGHVEIAKENYFLSGDGHLMPAKKGQTPPDLRYFTRSAK